MLKEFELNAKILKFTELYSNNMRISEKFLHSEFIIDGIAQEATAFELLEESMMVSLKQKLQNTESKTTIIDESIDPSPPSISFSDENIPQYLKNTSSREMLPLNFTDFITKQKVAEALLKKIWENGSFRLTNLCLKARWAWNEKKLGNMAALYSSFAAFSDYVFDLDVKIKDIKCEISNECEIDIKAVLNKLSSIEEKGEMNFKDPSFENAWSDGKRSCPETAVNYSNKDVKDNETWLLYIPFDTCEPRLGGSVLAQKYGENGGSAPQLHHPEYFVDCYEVVRELVEDKVVLAGTEVGEGGLAKALQTMDCGLNIELQGLVSSFPQCNKTQILFTEIPGVIIQIKNTDYDYVDGQLLLQDVAYYPLGHPKFDTKKLSLASEKDISISSILDALYTQASEGED